MAQGRKRWTCKLCQRHVDECGPLSARGKCRLCGDLRIILNKQDLENHDGEWFDHWRRKSLAAYGVFVDDPRAPEPLSPPEASATLRP